jgi:prepilin-type N-terminal cleavage/methylation domain-containing protein
MKGSRAGFTLAEVLLASVLMGLVVLAVYSLYDGSHRLGESARASGDMILQSQFAFRRIDADLRASWISSLDDELKKSARNRMNAGVASAVTAAGADPAAQAELTAFEGQSGEHAQGPDDYVEFLSAAGGGLGEARGDLVRVRYYLVRDEQFPHRSVLVRDARPFMTPRLGGTDRALPEDEMRVLARGVVGLQIRYRRDSQWLDDWSSAQQNDQWPTAVDVELTLKSAGGHVRKFRSKTYLRVPTEYDAPAGEETTESGQ